MMPSIAELSRLSERDRAVVELVAKFKQMTTGQIRGSLFSVLASATPLDRTLRRLLEQGYLARLRRLVGGDRGGSGQHVYQLGRAGWKLLDRLGAYWAPRAVSLHTLAVADCYVTLLRGELEVIQFITEPECRRAVGNLLLTPDAYVELGDRAERVKNTYFLEVDRGTEHLDKIQDKCARYWRAFQVWRDDYFPTVLFVVPDMRRAREVERAVANGPPEAKELFRCADIGSLADVTTAVEPTESE